MQTQSNVTVVGLYPLTKQDAMRTAIYIWSGSGTSASKQRRYGKFISDSSALVPLDWKGRACTLCDYANQVVYAEHKHFQVSTADRCPHCPMYNRWTIDPAYADELKEAGETSTTLPYCHSYGSHHHTWFKSVTGSSQERNAARRVRTNMMQAYRAMFSAADTNNSEDVNND